MFEREDEVLCFGGGSGGFNRFAGECDEIGVAEVE